MTHPHNHPPKGHDNHHDQEEFLDEEEHPTIALLKKIGLIIIALFLILMIITLSLPIDTLNSLLASIQLQQDPPDFTAQIGGATIVIQGATYKELLKAYHAEQQNEFKACLLGKKQDHIYTVDGIYLPMIHDQSFRHVLAERCKEGTIIDLHTHPYLSCIFSDQDISSLSSVKQANPDAIIGLMCDTDRFNFHGY